MKLSLSILIFSILLLSNCNKTQKDFNREALKHFYGYELNGGKISGILISSKDDGMKSIEVGVLRTIYHLSEDFIYYDEAVEIKEIQDFELFITYSLFLKNEKTKELVNIETKYYYSVFADEPVPLVSYAISNKQSEYLFEKNIWSGDFDAFIEQHIKNTIEPIDNN